jgi:hypothetical protein
MSALDFKVRFGLRKFLIPFWTFQVEKSLLVQFLLPSLAAGQHSVLSGCEVAIPQPAAVAWTTVSNEAVTPGVQRLQDTLMDRMDRVIQDRDSGSEGEDDTSAMEINNEGTA